MLSSARLGDKHVCPLPGHGTTPIASASGDININFMGAARVGDTCGCGAVITTGFPSIILNGRPMAHLGSPTSHGGTIITGSGDTFGGFVMGPTPDAAIINFATLGVFRPDGSVDDEKMATLLADPRLTEKATAANALIDPNATSKAPEEQPEEKACTDPDRMEELAAYIAGEMNANINSPSVRQMKDLNNFDPAMETRKYAELPFYMRLGPGPDFYSLALGKKAKAFAIWTERVGQNRPWDHKPKLKNLFGEYPWHKQGAYEYFYDIWSNIHYGYVGVAGGLSESVLLDGAGVEQIGSDTWRFIKNPKRFDGPQRTQGVEGMRAWDDVPDRVSIIIGMSLYKEYPNGGLTGKIIMDKVLAVPISDWAKGVQPHVCK
ncbi:Zn-binding Pro-Ala-Ala-Arg (PAAR) domain-containing protein, incolved in TypeVI secretion [Pseudomonas sp. NFIX51]|uniref:polymorphic toxin type 44 domain-containing protein n=1 Tax=Pseudomonas TaxID=286 RepID=UPI0008CA52D3|nr:MULTISPECIES: polymorphic toxin type 44 domain-containing protein [Pseudomonas]SEM18033.1 Zn-binding Pro-Ala-Ala-Arg (PAAR) domain-containing protein, incolved in TypeVI secretion [Pseudomonas sp. NFACC41-3]SMH61786.1 Zn-binding Pro-Ala-Ala-Arg (PAAR) domain-containing protein, incolved in TypeVI secretion [Pseudomonas sp. NFIX51]